MISKYTPTNNVGVYVAFLLRKRFLLGVRFSIFITPMILHLVIFNPKLSIVFLYTFFIFLC